MLNGILNITISKKKKKNRCCPRCDVFLVSKFTHGNKTYVVGCKTYEPGCIKNYGVGLKKTWGRCRADEVGYRTEEVGINYNETGCTKKFMGSAGTVADLPILTHCAWVSRICVLFPPRIAILKHKIRPAQSTAILVYNSIFSVKYQSHAFANSKKPEWPKRND